MEEAAMKEAAMKEALSSASLPFRRNGFLTYILETRVPGVHYDVVIDVGLTNTTTPPQICDHLILQNLEGRRGSDKPAMKSPPDDGLNGESSTLDSEENFGEPDAVVVNGLSHSQSLEFLIQNGSNFLMRKLDDNKERICSELLDMADTVKVLPPGNDPLPWNVLDMSQWKESLGGLINEMKTVEGSCCASVIGNSGVYVLTTSPYSAFLRALAMEITDRCC